MREEPFFNNSTDLIKKSYNKTRTDELNHPHDIVAASERFDYEYLNTGNIIFLFSGNCKKD